MKILVVAPTPFFSDRGTHIRILEEALALEKQGHEITIATYHIGKDIHKNIDTKIDVRRILRLLFWYKKLEAGPDWQKIILDLMLIRKVFFLTRIKKPDIIHGHLHEGAIIGWIIQKIFFWRNIKLVADFHGSLTREMLSHGYLKSGLKKTFSLIEKFINRKGDFAIVSSEELADEIRKSRHDGKIETVLDGTNTESFFHLKNKEDIRKELEIPDNKFIVVYTGGLVANKGIRYLMEAILAVLKERRDVFFLIGGFPTEHMEKFILENKLSPDDIRLVSPLDYFSLPEFLVSADVAIDPKDSDSRQASGKMLNYMSAGLPVVCFNKPNNKNYLGEGGYYCSERSGKCLAEGILHFMNNPEEAEKKGLMNKEKAEEFNWKKSAVIINNIYQKISPTKGQVK